MVVNMSGGRAVALLEFRPQGRRVSVSSRASARGADLGAGDLGRRAPNGKAWVVSVDACPGGRRTTSIDNRGIELGGVGVAELADADLGPRRRAVTSPTCYGRRRRTAAPPRPLDRRAEQRPGRVAAAGEVELRGTRAAVVEQPVATVPPLPWTRAWFHLQAEIEVLDVHAADLRTLEHAGLLAGQLPPRRQWWCLMQALSTWRRVGRWSRLGGSHRALGYAEAARQVLLQLAAHRTPFAALVFLGCGDGGAAREPNSQRRPVFRRSQAASETALELTGP